MVGIYLSGTGNTKYCIERLLSLIDASAKIIPLENEAAIKEIEKNNTIILAYPIQFSNAPYMVRDFICRKMIRDFGIVYQFMEFKDLEDIYR